MLEAVQSWLASEGESRALAIAGPVGIGKTTLLTDVAEYLATVDDTIVVSSPVTDTKTARYLADKARVTARRSEPATRVVLLVDDFGRLDPADGGALLDLNGSFPQIRVIVAITHPGRCENTITVPVAPLAEPADELGSATDGIVTTEAARFFAHCLRRHNPAAELTRADLDAVTRICASSFGIPSDIAALADLVDRHGLAAVAAAVREDGPRHRLGELFDDTEVRVDRPPLPVDASLSTDEMVVLASVFTATGGASAHMLRQTLPRCDIGGLTRSLVARGLVFECVLPGTDGAGEPSRRHHLRVTGLPAANWCAIQPEISLPAIRQAQADHLSSRIRDLSAHLCSPEQPLLLAEFRHEWRNLRCSVEELIHTGRHAQAVTLMWDALPLLARTHGITELLPQVLRVIREYTPTAAEPRVALYKLATYVLAVAGEQEAAAVCFEQLPPARSPDPTEVSADPDLTLLDILVAEDPRTTEGTEAASACFDADRARKDLGRLCESAPEYFGRLIRDQDFARVEARCRAALFEATRCGDDYAAGLLLLWRAAAAAGTKGAGGPRPYVERALVKLGPLGPEAVLSAIGKLVDNRHLRDLRRSGAQLAMVLGALGRADWPWTDGLPTGAAILPDLSDRLARRIGERTLERWSQAGESVDLVDLLCRILPAGPPESASDNTHEVPEGVTPPGETIDTTQLREKFGLTPRESEVATLVATGLTNKQIGHRLRISEWTAVNHLRQVMRKLECSSRVQVANWVRDLDATLGSLRPRPAVAGAPGAGAVPDFPVPGPARLQARSRSATSEASGSN
ncbi:LuxR C-terminal-related transcriptional regulator [Embleya sp. NBC_00888]|uniref:LuxR C-terminal-related transcriptional regulator n=1 Tax=Embleya sp. NBC_00888 TaxID=2975960 RepID=UPI0038706D97|nr:LuxR C-terminal-related transcriptional regulator [Embleya sp. NBC_00888]